MSQPLAAHSHVVSLADVDVGDDVEVRCILFDVVRARCAAAGIREGEVVRCVGATSDALLVRTALGAVAALDRFWARFVDVRRDVPHSASARRSR